jgi:hypothetical protein
VGGPVQIGIWPGGFPDLASVLAAQIGFGQFIKPPIIIVVTAARRKIISECRYAVRKEKKQKLNFLVQDTVPPERFADARFQETEEFTASGSINCSRNG